ncbi:MAG: pyridoxal phosphate enzyme (YggS family) [Candidatus Latescibacterota bacterium]|jgi:PLP dependent protein
MEHIRENWLLLAERIARAAERVGRAADAIEVVAVSKTRSAEEVEAACRCGLRVLGENRVQEAEGKKPAVGEEAVWHLIGHLQSNKAGKAVELFDMVQSVDRLSLASALARRAAVMGRRLDILVQVNTAGSQSQYGVRPEAAVDLVGQIAELPSLQVRGLMTIGAHAEDEVVVRASFARLRLLHESIAEAGLGVPMDYLSMGMSGDFECAIAEGANLLRLGTAIFGARS